MTVAMTTGLVLDPETEARLQRLAEMRRCSTGWLLQQAVNQYVEREEAHERLRRDGLAAWSEYQATGRHVTAEEADAWLAGLESGDEVPIPECRG